MSSDEKMDLIKQLQDYDYIRFSTVDFNGIPRGKTVPMRFAEEFIEHGVSGYTGLWKSYHNLKV